MPKAVYLYAQDTLSNWEPEYAVTELNSGRYFKNKGEKILAQTVGVSKKPIVTAGGVTLTPDDTLKGSAMFMLIGAYNWS